MDIQPSARYVARMIRRRTQYDPLQTSALPRWLTIRSFSGALLAMRRLEPGTDLVRAFLSAMLELIDTGWQLGEFASSSGAVRHERGTEKRMLAIEYAEPRLDGTRCGTDQSPASAR